MSLAATLSSRFDEMFCCRQEWECLTHVNHHTKNWQIEKQPEKRGGRIHRQRFGEDLCGICRERDGEKLFIFNFRWQQTCHENAVYIEDVATISMIHEGWGRWPLMGLTNVAKVLRALAVRHLVAINDQILMPMVIGCQFTRIQLTKNQYSFSKQCRRSFPVPILPIGMEDASLT